jgi:hypothetical protein
MSTLYSEKRKNCHACTWRLRKQRAGAGCVGPVIEIRLIVNVCVHECWESTQVLLNIKPARHPACNDRNTKQRFSMPDHPAARPHRGRTQGFCVVTTIDKPRRTTDRSPSFTAPAAYVLRTPALVRTHQLLHQQPAVVLQLWPRGIAHASTQYGLRE